MDMAKHGHPSADHPLMRNPNSSSPQVSSPPPQTKMATSFSGDFLTSGGATASTTTTTKPLTMFYNGGVAVFHLPQDKAEDLIKMAAGEKAGDGRAGPRHGEELLAKLRKEMPISSKRSLQRFFQKRKESDTPPHRERLRTRTNPSPSPLRSPRATASTSRDSSAVQCSHRSSHLRFLLPVSSVAFPSPLRRPGAPAAALPGVPPSRSRRRRPPVGELGECFSAIVDGRLSLPRPPGNFVRAP